MTTDLSYFERMIYRQSVITDLVYLGLNMKLILAMQYWETEQLEALLGSLIRLKINQCGDNK